MRFYRSQWVAIVLLDVATRIVGAAVLGLLAGGLVFFPAALKYSFIHLSFLISISVYLRTFNCGPRAAAGMSVLVANILFLLVFVSLSVYSVKIGVATACSGLRPDNYVCLWVHGQITSAGVRHLSLDAIAQLIVNLVPILIVWPFSPHWDEAAERRQQLLADQVSVKRIST